MSNYVYGFVQHHTTNEIIREKINALLEKQVPGIREIPTEELYNFPEQHLPDDSESYFVFELTDSKDHWHAQMLLGMMNYAPEADFDLPKAASDRAELLANILYDILNIKEAKKLLVAITDNH